MKFDPKPIISANDSLMGKLSTVSGWRLGRKLHEGRWLNQFEAATIATENSSFDYVFKTIKPGLSKEMLEQAISRLTSEAMVTEQVQQRNVIPLLDSELDSAPFFLVQPLVSGASLTQLIAAHQSIPMSRMFWLFRQTAEAISAVHDHHRIYGGVHPSHVLISQVGDVSLIGWGNSVPIGESLSAPLGQNATDPFWLAHFAAPEMFDDSYRATEASDVYSIGAMIYSLFAGQPPFEVPNMPLLEKYAKTCLHEDLQVLQPSCPGALNQLVNQMLTKNPQRRPHLKVIIDQLISLEIEHFQNGTLIDL